MAILFCGSWQKIHSRKNIEKLYYKSSYLWSFCGLMVKASDSWSRGHEFDSHWGHGSATLGHSCLNTLCRCLPSSDGYLHLWIVVTMLVRPKTALIIHIGCSPGNWEWYMEWTSSKWITYPAGNVNESRENTLLEQDCKPLHLHLHLHFTISTRVDWFC